MQQWCGGLVDGRLGKCMDKSGLGGWVCRCVDSWIGGQKSG